ncbi:MAG: helix-turn-helix domain-containing protein [Oscillospiraceae bacterium]|nr:helix-turn-helix domain-containing protein [Oscillospiraceae bacterium]
MLEDCAIRKSLIYDLEKRDYTPSAELLEKIAIYLDISVDYLLGRTPFPEVNRPPLSKD